MKIAKELGLEEQTTVTPTEADGERGGEAREAVAFTLAKELFPDTWPQANDVEVVLVNLNADEEEECLVNGKGISALINLEMAKIALANGRWNGRPIDRGTAEDEVLWNKMGSRCRNLVVGMFLRMWSAPGKEVQKAQDTFRITKIRA